MELRILRYFFESARQGSITRAAELLHVTQPTMSRQLKDLEYELGETLFTRTNYAIKLTAAGELLYKRAEDILAMVDKTKLDFETFNDADGGEVAIGCAESKNIQYLARCIQAVQSRHPNIRYNLYAGDTERVAEKLDKGIFDFTVLMENVNLEKYNCITIPAEDVWGVVMRRDSPLAIKSSIIIEDLFNLPLITSRQSLRADLPKWFGDRVNRLNITATTDLPYNGSVLVREGIGYMLTIDGLTDTSLESGLCFRPLYPKLSSAMHITWVKYQTFTPAAAQLLAEIRKQFSF